MKLGKYDDITKAITKLYWLPIGAIIDFKITVLIWKGLNNMALYYIKDMFKIKDNRSGLRSNNSIIHYKMR